MNNTVRTLCISDSCQSNDVNFQSCDDVEIDTEKLAKFEVNDT